MDSSEAPVKYDIYSTMFGGIPNSEIADLKKYWDAFPTLQKEVFAAENDRPYSSMKTDDVLGTIASNADVTSFKDRFAEAFRYFKGMLHTRLIDNVMLVKDVMENDIISEEIFRRMESLPLVDKYAAYQILADNWNGIIGDIEIIQTEGIEACKVVEPKTKMVKDKNGVEQEVEDGLKGRIIPFELVQKTLFQSDMDAISALQIRVEAIDGELDAVRDELLSMEDTDKYFDAEKDNAFLKKEITADSKPKADVEDEIKEQLKQIVKLWDEQSAKNKQIKADKIALEKKTIETIEALDMSSINQFLELKWIVPITSAIEALPDSVIQSLADSVNALNEKYAVTYNDIEQSLEDSEQNLATLIGQLTGDEFAISGLSNLIKK